MANARDWGAATLVALGLGGGTTLGMAYLKYANHV
jgi:hypothetical protein